MLCGGVFLFTISSDWTPVVSLGKDGDWKIESGMNSLKYFSEGSTSWKWSCNGVNEAFGKLFDETAEAKQESDMTWNRIVLWRLLRILANHYSVLQKVVNH